MRRRIGQYHLDLVSFGHDPRGTGDYLRGQRGQPGAGGRDEPREAWLIPGGATGPGDELVRRRGGTVVHERGGARVGAAAQGQLVRDGEIRRDPPGARWDLEQQ